jgi:uncharacterized protein YecT (DUF1311 family)
MIAAKTVITSRARDAAKSSGTHINQCAKNAMARQAQHMENGRRLKKNKDTRLNKAYKRVAIYIKHTKH